MKTIHFKGIKQSRIETPSERKKRIQESFLRDYEEYQLSKKKDILKLNNLKKYLGI